MKKLPLSLLLLLIPLTARGQTRTDFCTALMGGGGDASCTITLQQNQTVVVSGTAFGGYSVFDGNGFWTQANFQFTQSYADPNSSTHGITTGISSFFTGTHSGTDSFHVFETQFNIGSSVVVTQWSGLSQANNNGLTIVDASTGNNGTAGGSGTVTGGNLNTTLSGDLLIVVGSAANNGQTLGVGASYTQDANYHYSEVVVGTYVASLTQHQIAGAPGPYDTPMSVSAGGLWAVVGIAIPISPITARPTIRRQVY